MDGWMNLWTHERADELRMEAEKRRFVQELRAARTKERGGRVPGLLRGLIDGLAGLGSRTAHTTGADVGCADDPESARQPGRACDVHA